mgnify:CR=1 FL=1
MVYHINGDDNRFSLLQFGKLEIDFLLLSIVFRTFLDIYWKLGVLLLVVEFKSLFKNKALAY